MKWLRVALRLPLLVVLLGGSTVARGRDLPWSQSGVARGTPTEAAPDDYVRSGWRRQTPGARLQRGPPAHSEAALDPAASPAPASTQQLRRLRHRDEDAVPEHDYHSPHFPTGPPPHS